jgi:hypothetical protein
MTAAVPTPGQVNLTAADGGFGSDSFATPGIQAAPKRELGSVVTAFESLPAEYSDDSLALRFTQRYGADLRYTAT